MLKQKSPQNKLKLAETNGDHAVYYKSTQNHPFLLKATQDHSVFFKNLTQPNEIFSRVL